MVIKEFIEWLELDAKRGRRVLAMFTAVIWAISTIVSYILYASGFDTIAVYSLVTAQFATVIAFYMSTKADTD